MCGITGYLNRDGAPAVAAIVQAMTDAVAHRGPDGEGVWTDGPVGLGHRRLAIIDLSDAAAQPMLSADGNFALNYNGEVYNFRELRTELQARGHRFRSASDSEVVLQALIEWGPAALDRFNGMFALAFWDKRTRKLLLARDRYGIKPLYYIWNGHTLAFGSEIKALLKHDAVRADLDLEGLLEYMTFQNFLSDRTLFKGVRLLPAGSRMIVSCGSNGSPVSERYWDFDFREPDVSCSAEECVEELDRLFQQAVSRQLVSDVSVASYLSGGIDSGSITAVAARQVPHLRSFTVGFDIRSASGLEVQFDERETAEYMSYLFGTEHYEMVLKAGDMVRCLPRMAWHIEEPRVGQSYPNFYAAQLVSRSTRWCWAGSAATNYSAAIPGATTARPRRRFRSLHRSPITMSGSG